MKSGQISLSAKIMIGLIAGVLCGVFFGEPCRYLNFIGAAYVNLLQMSVLPFIVLSLIHGIGSLNAPQARKFASTGGIFLLVFWLIGIAAVLAGELAFPKIESATFFSSMAGEIAPTQGNPLDTYIPANPFRSLADSVIPAVVVFSLLVGIAMIGIEGKEPLMRGLQLLTKALMRVAGFAVKIAPIGVFALTASAAGTLSVSEFSRLQVYIVTTVVIGSLLMFAVIPGLICALTPFRYRNIFSVSRDAFVLAFTTANSFIVLPLIVENVKTLFSGVPGSKEGERDSLIGIMPPVAFNFSLPGKLLPLLFVFFTAWFYGRSLGLTDHLQAIALAIPSFTGSPRSALPFLLQQMGLPRDIFQLYLVSEILVDRLQTLLTCACLFAFTILGTARMSGVLKIDLRKLTIFLVTCLVATAALVLATRHGLYLLTKNTYHGKETVLGMQINETVPAKVFRTRQEVDLLRTKGELSGPASLGEIRRRKVLRVGYRPDVIPFAYFNDAGELVGYDISTAHRLAKDIGCSLEFIPTDRQHFADDLRNGYIDIMMSKVVVRPEYFSEVTFTESYLTLHAAFVTDDNRKEEFVNLDEARKKKGLRIAISKDNFYGDALHSLLPDATLVVLDRKEVFFKDKVADALFVTAEEGACWTLMYPFFDVAAPVPPPFLEALAYPVARGSNDLSDYLNHWISIQQQLGRQQAEYDYWILGKNLNAKKKRWSVIADVLHWTD